jgi:hypothetical protein
LEIVQKELENSEDLDKLLEGLTAEPQNERKKVLLIQYFLERVKKEVLF